MKLFTEGSVAEEVLNNMKLNLVKNASVQEQSDTAKYLKALSYLSEAAELFEKSGNYKKANQLTQLISSLVIFNEKTDAKIKSKIASLDGAVDGLISTLTSKDELKSHYHNMAVNKLASILSTRVSNKSFEDNYAEIKNAIFKFKETYSANPKALALVSNASEVANSVLQLVSDEEDESWED